MVPTNIVSLRRECYKNGIILNPGRKYSKEELVKIISFNNFKKLDNIYNKWSLVRRLHYFSPQLSTNFSNLKIADQQELLYGDKWVAEENYSGYRVFLMYHPNEGFAVYSSRELDEVTFLPKNLTSKVFIKNGGKLSHCSSFVDKFKNSFVLDAMIISKSMKIDETFFDYDFKLSKILSTPYDFVMLDLLEFDEHDYSSVGYDYRRKKVIELDNIFLKEGINIRKGIVHIKNKKQFYDDVVSGGGDGIMFKNLYSKYISKFSRSGKVMVKLKNNQNINFGHDLYMYVSGVDHSKKSNILLKLSSNIISGSDEIKGVHVCSVPIPTVIEFDDIINKNGKDYSLSPKYSGKVFLVNCMNYLSESRTFLNVKFLKVSNNRTAKSCIFDENIVIM
jgi:hypothetical protein